MKFLAFSVLALLALAQAKEEKQEKRGAVQSEQAQLLKYTAQPAQQQYASGPQYQYESEQQRAPVQVSAQKYAVAPQQAPHYSLAGDVSSFSYSSPVVQYNSLGFLNQLAGNIAGKSAPAQVQYQAAPAPQKITYAQPAPVAYQPQQVQKVVYAQQPQYQAAPVAYRTAPAAYQASPVAYRTAAAPQQVAYSAAPAAYRNASPQQVVYRTAQPEYQTAQPVEYQSAQPQYQQYQLAQQYQAAPQYQSAPQQYQTAAPSAAQPIYTSGQYYQSQQADPSKYAQAGITYAQ